MKNVQVSLGVLCAIIGIVPSHIMYAMSGDGNLWNPTLFGMMTFFSGISLLVFCLCRRWMRSRNSQILFGAMLNYIVFASLVLVVAAIDGLLGETLMWFPVIAIFGFLYTAPMLALCWIGSGFIFPKKVNE